MLQPRQQEGGIGNHGDASSGTMEMRPLGKTGESLSVIGFGAIVFVNEGPGFARDTVARAIDAGALT